METHKRMGLRIGNLREETKILGFDFLTQETDEAWIVGSGEVVLQSDIVVVKRSHYCFPTKF